MTSISIESLEKARRAAFKELPLDVQTIVLMIPERRSRASQASFLITGLGPSPANCQETFLATAASSLLLRLSK